MTINSSLDWKGFSLALSLVKCDVSQYLCDSSEILDYLFAKSIYYFVGGVVASWLVRRSSLGRAVRVRALAGDIKLCSWAKHFALTMPLSTQVYEWVPANLMLGVIL